MRREERLALTLCGSSPGREEIRRLLECSDLDWDRFLETVFRHQVAAPALQRLLEHPLPEASREHLQAVGREEIVRAAWRRNILETELARVAEALRANGIDFVLLKGLSLDFSGTRETGDLDLLVRRPALCPAMAALAPLGYGYVGHRLNRLLTPKERHSIEAQLSWNNQYQLENRTHGLLLELHINLFEGERVYVEDLDTLLEALELFWDGRRYDERLGCSTLSHGHLLLLMCLHNALKRSPANNRFILRNVMDIDALAVRVTDWDGFACLCRRLKVAPFAWFSLALAHRLLGTPVPVSVLEALADGCTRGQFLLAGLHLGCLRSPDRTALLASKLYTILKPLVFGRCWRDRVRGLLLVPILFPPRWKMASRYRLPEQSPLVYLTYPLNPLRWVFLGLRSLFAR